uniref:Pentatricopeptide repeat-containing protein n=1 Tax=Ananas comosus var. bracteatus TaxID=296719 RepID=A0A6V7NRQ1_ANACO|nr:unnamed protein product [Ananas comosus var. bracteatus]
MQAGSGDPLLLEATLIKTLASLAVVSRESVHFGLGKIAPHGEAPSFHALRQSPPRPPQTLPSFFFFISFSFYCSCSSALQTLPLLRLQNPHQAQEQEGEEEANPNPNPNPQPPPLLLSPVLSDAISASSSLLSSPSPPSPNSLLRSFCVAGASPSDAIAFFLHLSPSFSPDRSTFLLLLSHSAAAAEDDDADDDALSHVVRVLDLMAGAGHAPDAAAVDLAVRALCSAGRLDDACGLVRHAALRTDPRPAPPDAYTYNFLVRRLARSRPVSAVYAFIEELRRDAGLRPDLVTYTILIDAVCRSGNLREAVRLLGVLTDAGFKPDCYLYNTIMKGYCMMDECGGVMEVYNRMRDEGVEPDLVMQKKAPFPQKLKAVLFMMVQYVTYNTLVYGLSKAGMISQARKFLSVMAEMGHFPDAVTYTALMSGMCRKGDASGALGLLGEMEQKGCEPNECTYNTLLMGLCKAKCLDKAVELYGTMTAGGMKVDSPAYATFVRALCRANRVAEAYEVFDYAVGSKSLMDVTAYMALENSLKWLRKGRV